jgi:hypothetical protein
VVYTLVNDITDIHCIQDLLLWKQERRSKREVVSTWKNRAKERFYLTCMARKPTWKNSPHTCTVLVKAIMALCIVWFLNFFMSSNSAGIQRKKFLRASVPSSRQFAFPGLKDSSKT